jgi:hypothetical protein
MEILSDAFKYHSMRYTATCEKIWKSPWTLEKLRFSDALLLNQKQKSYRLSRWAWLFTYFQQLCNRFFWFCYPVDGSPFCDRYACQRPLANLHANRRSLSNLIRCQNLVIPGTSERFSAWKKPLSTIYGNETRSEAC